MYFLRKAHDVPDGRLCAVVRNGLTAHSAEDPVLIGYRQLGAAIRRRDMIHLKAAVRRRELSRIQILCSITSPLLLFRLYYKM